MIFCFYFLGPHTVSIVTRTRPLTKTLRKYQKCKEFFCFFKAMEWESNGNYNFFDYQIQILDFIWHLLYLYLHFWQPSKDYYCQGNFLSFINGIQYEIILHLNSNQFLMQLIDISDQPQWLLQLRSQYLCYYSFSSWLALSHHLTLRT